MSWKIEIDNITTFVDGDVDKVCRILSKNFKGSVLTLTAMARVRRRYKDGEILNDYPDVNIYYSNITPQLQYSWEKLFELNE